MSTIIPSDQTVSCSRCNYDLRGTVIGGDCPECGLPVSSSLHGLRVEGKYLVVRGNMKLPPRCVITNEDVDSKPIDKTLYWSHPALVLLILINVLVFLIVAMIVRKKCRLMYCLNDAQKSQKAKKVATALTISLGALAAGIVLAIYDQPIGLAVGIVACVIGFIFAAVFSRTLRIAKVKRGEFWISGASPAFLDSLAEQSMSKAA